MDLSSLSSVELSVLVDMVDYWMDKDRHGELEREYNYTQDEIDAVYSFYSAIR